MAPQTMADTIVDVIGRLIERCQWSKQHWINFNGDKEEIYLDPARQGVDSLVRFLTYLTKSSSRQSDMEMTQTSIDEHNRFVIEIINALINSKHVRTEWAAFCKSMSQDLNPA